MKKKKEINIIIIIQANGKEKQKAEGKQVQVLFKNMIHQHKTTQWWYKRAEWKWKWHIILDEVI